MFLEIGGFNLFFDKLISFSLMVFELRLIPCFGSELCLIVKGFTDSLDILENEKNHPEKKFKRKSSGYLFRNNHSKIELNKFQIHFSKKK